MQRYRSHTESLSLELGKTFTYEEFDVVLRYYVLVNLGPLDALSYNSSKALVRYDRALGLWQKSRAFQQTRGSSEDQWGVEGSFSS